MVSKRILQLLKFPKFLSSFLQAVQAISITILFKHSAFIFQASKGGQACRFNIANCAMQTASLSQMLTLVMAYSLMTDLHPDCPSTGLCVAYVTCKSGSLPTSVGILHPSAEKLCEHPLWLGEAFFYDFKLHLAKTGQNIKSQTHSTHVFPQTDNTESQLMVLSLWRQTTNWAGERHSPYLTDCSQQRENIEGATNRSW